MSSTEQIVNFSCQGKQLIGILHQPRQAMETGLLCIVAGAAQYRIGCCRQQVTLARQLADHGVPVMRFDYRGMGDAEGEYPGSDRSVDINAAIDAFLAASPGLEDVVLYGGCDGASAVAISGWRHPKVAAWALNNPYTEVAKAKAKATLKHHYVDRLKSKEFWKRVFRFEFDVLGSLRSIVQDTKTAFSRPSETNGGSDDPFDTSRPFTDRMLEGWKRFDREVLLLMSGRSVVAREFDECVANSKAWQSVVHRPQVQRVDLVNASQTFSEPAALAELGQVIADWFSQRNG